MKNIEPKSACCSAPVKSVGMGDFHDKDEVCTMHMECLACHEPCNIKHECSFGKENCPWCKPEADEGKSLAASVLPPSSADLRDLLHDFAMTYRVESRKSRNECIDNVIMKIGNLMEENQSLRNQNRVLQDCVAAVTEKNSRIFKDCRVMYERLKEISEMNCIQHMPSCSDKADIAISQISQYPKPE